MNKLKLNIKKIVYPLIIIIGMLIFLFLIVSPFFKSSKYDSLYKTQSTIVGTVINSEKNILSYSTRVNVNNSIVNVKTSSFISEGTELELIETDKNNFELKSEIDTKTTLSPLYKLASIMLGLFIAFLTGLLWPILSDDYHLTKFFYEKSLEDSTYVK